MTRSASTTTPSWSIEQLRAIIETGEEQQIGGVTVHWPEAQAVVALHAALSPRKQALLEQMPLTPAIRLAWRIIRRRTAASEPPRTGGAGERMALTPDERSSRMAMDVRIDYHGTDRSWAAVIVRNGEPWYLDGALVGLGSDPGDAVSELCALAQYLVIEGENFLTEQPLSLADRLWLFLQIDLAYDDAMYVALREAYGSVEAMRNAEKKLLNGE